MNAVTKRYIITFTFDAFVHQSILDGFPPNLTWNGVTSRT